MNRWISYLGENAMVEMKEIAPKIKTYQDWTREFLALADRKLSDGMKLEATYYYRSAEFFMFSDDPGKIGVRKKFLDLILQYYGIGEGHRHLIPYESGSVKGRLPCYRFTPDKPKGVIIVFGGFDSYIEEFFPIIMGLAGSGYDTVAFEGPGQGGALEDFGLAMTHEWEKPVSAVLDYFELKDVTLIGGSLGGYLAIRAAAFEPRITKVIAFDIMYDFSSVVFRQLSSFSRALLSIALDLHASKIVNALVVGQQSKRPVAEWGVKHGMHVTGTGSPYGFFKAIRLYNTAAISSLVRQDVLLLAGSEDHYVPLWQFYRQIEALGNVRSLTARLFTRAERAQNHCQVGNMGLAEKVMLDWIGSKG